MIGGWRRFESGVKNGKSENEHENDEENAAARRRKSAVQYAKTVAKAA